MQRALILGTDVMLWILLLALVLFIPKLIFMVFGFFKQKKLPKAEMDNFYSVLIPARNESRVIVQLLESIKNQTYPKDKLDIYVMVTDKDDPTVEICKKYNNTKVIVVDPDLNSKGKTLDICLKEILASNPDKYNAHFVIDADNVLADDFIEQLNNAYVAGYDIAMGRRINKIWKEGWVSNCSALLFTYVNSFNNKFRSKCKANITISGSGFYISNTLIKEWGGLPFHSLTEDYELTKYALINDIKTYYNEYALIADEQPITMEMSKRQRFRWIKGHNNCDAIYNKQLFRQLFASGTKSRFFKFDHFFALIPILLIVMAFTFFSIFSLSIFVISLITAKAFAVIALKYFLLSVLCLYGLLILYTILAFIIDYKYIKTNFWQSVVMILLNPIFLATFVPIYVKSFIVKEVLWQPIEHKINVSK